MPKIYKYTSIANAIKIIKNNSLILTCPNDFNDPYDCLYRFDEDDYEKTKKIFIEHIVIKAMEQFSDMILPSMKSADRILVANFKKSVEIMKSSLREHPYYDGIPMCESILKLIYKKLPSLKIQIEGAIAQFKQKLVEIIQGFRDDALVSCFSKRNDSILMWSHYANSHKGVCIELEMPDDKAFKEVDYNTEVPTMKVYEIMRHVIALQLLDESDNKMKESYDYREAIAPFYTKSFEWAYEEEVRCVYSKKENNGKFSIDENGKYILRINNPTGVYVGSKVEKNDLDELLKLLDEKRIPIHYMKVDEKYYNIVEINDNNETK